MITLVFVILFGVIFSYFATINTGQITVNFGYYQVHNIPIYLAILVSCAVGMLLAVILHFLKYLSAYFILGKKEKDLKETNKRIAELTRDLHKLELENTKLKSTQGKEDYDEDSLG
ncbi:MAG: hypothetical protein US95_C0042G0002 [Candidatus Woesebacteria bacterium GW2011_GWB1_38_5]|uniref:Lipopolysaccharide assembly protein A domain-containing protein n=3 Tax=Candidatus Woeseibacteriota TaxID=1752722 RepID=A0A0G0KXZ9_9BACT|nr:MAG: hypothetical protein US75_C0010G0015 [Candidatus Woesebacteria bacterium GW2011_GWC1_38_13]KKQ73876.1 MAG: hypothetical protein US95_C0042G0002 [Candidatus Woesebacteria bacterium GW2011_GWB1_38_5]KKQ76676.1 MAG: hypothetical protein US97_C0001G0024 [Microgenomates group bacterium GW2011_GWF1_38_5]KKQ83627.1 MAG: hypothetical protein UT06_C0019G0007 [Candidatus Woesebacteria bacterium GW2011_GWA1_38_8]